MPKHYKLTPAQSEVWRLYESGKRKIAFIGGIRAGKTFLGAKIFTAEAYRNRNLKSSLGWIVAGTYPLSRVPEREFEFTIDRAAIHRRLRNERAYELKNNFRIEIKTAENPDRLRGPGLAIAWVDEASLISERAWDILLGRVLDTDGILLLTTTPRGRNWLYHEFYIKSLTDPDYVVVQSKTEGNPYVSKEEIEKLRSRYKGDFSRQELDAEFVVFSGLVFRSFDPVKHVIPSPLKLTGKEVVFAGIDFGFNDPFVCLWIAKQDGRYIVFDEHYYANTTLNTHAVLINRRCRRAERFWADPSGAQERAELQRYHVPTIPFQEKSILVGIQMINYLLTTNLADGKPMLQVTDNCVHTIEEFGIYSYREPKDDHNPGEEPIDAFNHCMDALRGAIGSEFYSEFKMLPKMPKREIEPISGYTPIAQEMRRREKELMRITKDKNEDFYDGWLD
ncbi:MAG: phage terminase large subunit [Bacillota bacterium]